MSIQLQPLNWHAIESCLAVYIVHWYVNVYFHRNMTISKIYRHMKRKLAISFSHTENT